MQLTLILNPGTRPARTPLTPEPVLVRPIRKADLDAVGELYWRSYPGGEVGDKADAVADVRASWAGAYGTWLPNASLLAEVDGCPVATVLTVDRPPWRDVSDLVFIIDLSPVRHTADEVWPPCWSAPP